MVDTKGLEKAAIEGKLDHREIIKRLGSPRWVILVTRNGSRLVIRVVKRAQRRADCGLGYRCQHDDEI
ncbi:MAG: hypothetical protein GY820_05750 [Gammaproteobacteria bacterium]|nr:hypothetical protein [Gammaproteobacteria bacterium]